MIEFRKGGDMTKAGLWGCALAAVFGLAGGGEAAAAGSGTVHAVPDTSPVIGGWAGRIGSYKVMVCIGTDGGSYLYASHAAKAPLALSAQDDAGRQWEEQEQGPAGKVSGHWRLGDVSGRVLQGQWTDAAGKRSLPISLERVGEPGGCDFAALQRQAGLHPETVTSGKEAVRNGIHYRTISALDGSVNSIQLIDAGGRYDALNKKLRENFAKEISDGEECQAGSSLNNGLLGWSYSSGVEPVALHGGRWLTLRSSLDYYCGGAHPDSGSFLQTVDVRSGAPLDIGRWIKMGKDGALPASLSGMIGRQAMAQRGGGKDDDCAEVYASDDSAFSGYNMSLGAHGIVFQKELPHVVYACSEDVEIPFAQLAPFLTAAGKAEIKLLQQGAGAGKQ